MTSLLHAWRSGQPDALDRLLPLVYDHLRGIARRKLADERSGTLQPTELVHEAFVKLVGASVPWEDRAHFLAVAGRAMRQVLVEHARRRNSEKRGAGVRPVTLEPGRVADLRDHEALVQIDDALTRLAALDERQARVVELQLFAGLTYAETAEVLDISEATVDRDLRLARAWLTSQLAAS